MLKLPLLKATWPLVQVAGPLFTSVEFKVFTFWPLNVSPPFADTGAAVPKVPPVQSMGPKTVTGIVPCRNPLEKFRALGVIAPLPLKLTVPPLIIRAVFVTITVPSNRAAPPRKLFVPPTFIIP